MYGFHLKITHNACILAENKVKLTENQIKGKEDRGLTL